MHRFQRLWKPLLAVAAVLTAFTVTFVWPQRNGLDIDIDGSPRAQAARNRDPYDLTDLQVLNRAILETKDHYVEPGRVEPRRMLLAGLNAIQRKVAPVLVHYTEDQGSLTVQVNNKRRSFRIDDIDSPWALAGRFRKIFGFLQRNLEDEDLELRQVEYAAVNGMLRTLDPHTVLLTPDVFEEMQMNTRGEFGGLGIVISVRDGHLTVIQPMPETPASRSGLESGDRIVKINDESTLNMPLSEAVDRLRGPPGSKVTVWITREKNGSWSDPKRHQIVRAVIHIDSVESKMLGEGIGYVKINNFQGNTYEDMRRALSELRNEAPGNRLAGLVLDMRDNPGGLLEQAVRVADTFLSSGTIVTTSSSDPKQRDEKFARRKGTEPDYPIVALVNGSSASASEIVAGSLKNHNRAVVVGQRTFGKGSVQVLYNFQDGSALKLTIAQYMTPGDVSIQGVGIVPDIGIDPMTIDRDDMDLAVDKQYLRESDLRQHLGGEGADDVEPPPVVLRYYLPSEKRRELQEAGPREQKENEEESEFLTRFSKMLLAKAQATNRRELLDGARPVIEQVRDEELDKAVAALRDLGVDWTEGDDEGASAVDVQVSTNRSDDTVTAGEPFELQVEVTNTGEAPLYQLRAQTESDFGLFGDRELVFGKLEPGATRKWSTTLGRCSTEDGERKCVVPRSTHDRADGIKINFTEAHGRAPDPAEIRTRVRALPKPQFAYALQVADDVQGNGDGRLQPGEHATMYLRVKNTGEGRAYETQANLRNLSGSGILLHDGRFHIDHMKPGEERLVRLTFEVLSEFERDEAKLEVSVSDMDLGESVNEKVLIPVAGTSEAPKARRGKITLAEGTEIRERPEAASDVVARVEDGGVRVSSQAELGDFVRIDAGGGRPGWVAAQSVGSGKASGGRIVPHLNHMPPQLKVDHGDMLVTRDKKLQLSGVASDEQQVRDLYIFVGARKVFYKSNRGASDLTKLEFSTEVPLHGGVNYITVFAREREDVVSRETFVVRRDAPDGSLMDTPRYQDELFGTGWHDEPGADTPSPSPSPGGGRR